MSRTSASALRQRTKDQLDRVGLLGAAYAVRQAARSARPEILRGNLETLGRRVEGAPLPPLRLIYAIGGHFDRAAFLRMGADNFEDIVHALTQAGLELRVGNPRVLDFGCGCGRVLRHWNRLPNVVLSGVDTNLSAVRWCRRNLPRVDVRQNDPWPPLPHPDASFDAVYSISVFTHLTLEGQRAWVDELRRVLRPGGLLVVTTHGGEAARRLSPTLRAHLAHAGTVVLHEGRQGSNLCAAYHSEPYLRSGFAPAFEAVSFAPSSLRWSTHDITVFRAPDADGADG